MENRKYLLGVSLIVILLAGAIIALCLARVFNSSVLLLISIILFVLWLVAWVISDIFDIDL